MLDYQNVLTSSFILKATLMPFSVIKYGYNGNEHVGTNNMCDSCL